MKTTNLCTFYVDVYEICILRIVKQGLDIRLSLFKTGLTCRLRMVSRGCVPDPCSCLMSCSCSETLAVLLWRQICHRQIWQCWSSQMALKKKYIYKLMSACDNIHETPLHGAVKVYVNTLHHLHQSWDWLYTAQRCGQFGINVNHMGNLISLLL